MKILLIGASGTLGRAVAAELGARHDIITAGRKTGDVRIDLADKASIAAALARLAPLDAVVSTAGNVAWGPVLELTDSDWMLGVSDKLLGQINVARLAAGQLRDGGSITLTTGILAEEPIRTGVQATTFNAAILRMSSSVTSE